MTTYTTTFAGQTTGSGPTNFTSRYDANTDVTVENPGLGEEDSRVLEFGTGDSGDVFYSFDDVDGDANRANCELLARFRVGASDERLAILRARASGTSGSDKTCYDLYAYSNSISILRFVSGSGSVLASTNVRAISLPLAQQSKETYGNYPPNQWIWMRFRVNGTGATVTLEGKIWLDGFPEPTDWTITDNDTIASRITSAGWSGLAKRGFSTPTYLDYFSVGTNGDSVAIAGGTPSIRASQTSAEVLVAEPNPTVRQTQTNLNVMYSPQQNFRVTQTHLNVMYSTAVEATGQSVACIITT